MSVAVRAVKTAGACLPGCASYISAPSCSRRTTNSKSTRRPSRTVRPTLLMVPPRGAVHCSSTVWRCETCSQQPCRKATRSMVRGAAAGGAAAGAAFGAVAGGAVCGDSVCAAPAPVPAAASAASARRESRAWRARPLAVLRPIILMMDSLPGLQQNRPTLPEERRGADDGPRGEAIIADVPAREPDRPTEPLLAILVANWNTAALIERCVEAILAR